MKLFSLLTKQARENPRKKLVLIVSFVALAAAIFYQFFFVADMSASRAKVSQLSSEENRKADVEKKQSQSADEADPEERPESVELLKSVESMANDFVAGAIDSNEALAFLVKQESKRILALNETISEYRKTISANTFAAALEKGKLANINDYIQADVEKLKSSDEKDSQSFSRNTGPYYQQQSGPLTEVKSEDSTTALDEFKLLSILQYQGEWIARVSIAGAPQNIRKGQDLGGVKVVKVTDTMVRLTDGTNHRDLYIF